MKSEKVLNVRDFLTLIENNNMNKFILILIILISPTYLWADKVRVLLWQNELGSSTVESRFKEFEGASGQLFNKDSDYFGSSLVSSSTNINRLVSYHYLWQNRYGFGYTEFPFNVNVKLADGRSYVRELRINEMDVSLTLGSIGSGFTVGKGVGMLGEDKISGDSSFVIVSYSPKTFQKFGLDPTGVLPPKIQRSVEVLLAYRLGKYEVKKDVSEIQSGQETWTVEYNVFQIGLGTRF